jgi:hypothetical protein
METPNGVRPASELDLVKGHLVEFNYGKGRSDRAPQNPLRLDGVVSSLLALALGGFSLPMALSFALSEAPQQAASSIAEGNASQVFPLLRFVLACIATLHAGALLLRGLSFLPALVVRGDVPKGFRNAEGIAQCLEGRKLVLDAGLTTTPLRALAGLGAIGQQCMLLSPLRLATFTRTYLRLRQRAIWGLIAITVGGMTFVFLPSGHALRPAAMIIGGLGVLLALLATIDAAIIYLSLPHETPPERVDYRFQQEAGSHRPEMLLDFFEDAARRAETSDLPNSMTLLSPPTNVEHDFARRILIEQKPLPLDAMSQPAAKLALLAGALAVLGGWFGMFGATSMAASTTDWAAAWAPITTAALAGVLGIVAGTGFRGTARELLSVYRFRSLATLAILRGTTSESKLHVGKAKEDSVLSENTAFRTEMLLSYYSAILTSEAASLLGGRELVEMTTDERTSAIADRIGSLLREKIRSGVVIAHPDTQDPSLMRIVELNAAMPALRQNAIDHRASLAPAARASTLPFLSVEPKQNALPAAPPTAAEAADAAQGDTGEGDALDATAMIAAARSAVERLSAGPEREEIVALIAAADSLLASKQAALALRIATKAFRMAQSAAPRPG